MTANSIFKSMLRSKAVYAILAVALTLIAIAYIRADSLSEAFNLDDSASTDEETLYIEADAHRNWVVVNNTRWIYAYPDPELPDGTTVTFQTTFGAQVWTQTSQIFRNAENVCMANLDFHPTVCGTYTIKATAINYPWSNTLSIHVSNVNLCLDDLPEEDAATPNELSPGGFIPLNNGDVNSDGVEDYAQRNLGPLETLRTLTMEWQPIYSSNYPAWVTLSCSPAVAQKIKIWKDQGRVNQVVLEPLSDGSVGKSWQVGSFDLQSDLWVEGIKASDTLGDVGLQLRWQGWDQQQQARDYTDTVSATVMACYMRATRAGAAVGALPLPQSSKRRPGLFVQGASFTPKATFVVENPNVQAIPNTIGMRRTLIWGEGQNGLTLMEDDNGTWVERHSPLTLPYSGQPKFCVLANSPIAPGTAKSIALQLTEPFTKKVVYQDVMYCSGLVVEIDDLEIGSYYANSPCWLPFKIKVLGVSGNVTLTGSQVSFRIGGVPQFQYNVIGKLAPSNGDSNNYLTLIAENLFDNVSTNGDQVQDATIKVDYLEFTDDSTGSTYKLNPGPGQYQAPGSTESRKIVFGDSSIKVVHLFDNGTGSGAEIDLTDTVTRQNILQGNSSCGYFTVQNQAPFPATNLPDGMTRQNDCVPYPGGSAVSYKQRSMCAVSGGVFTTSAYEARNINKQTGAAWVCYRPIIEPTTLMKPTTNPFDVPVVGKLTSSISAKVTLLPGGTIYYSTANTCSTPDNSNGIKFTSDTLCGASDACFAAPPVAASMYIVGTILGAASQVSELHPAFTDTAHVSAIYKLGSASMVPPKSPSQSDGVDMYYYPWSGITPISSQDIGLRTVKTGFSQALGSSYRSYMTTTTEVRKTWWGTNGMVDAQVSVNAPNTIVQIQFLSTPPDNNMLGYVTP